MQTLDDVEIALRRKAIAEEVFGPSPYGVVYPTEWALANQHDLSDPTRKGI